MGQHVEIFANHVGDTDIIARFRVKKTNECGVLEVMWASYRVKDVRTLH